MNDKLPENDIGYAHLFYSLRSTNERLANSVSNIAKIVTAGLALQAGLIAFLYYRLTDSELSGLFLAVLLVATAILIVHCLLTLTYRARAFFVDSPPQSRP